MPLVRLADLLAGLSRLADLGLGVQSGESVRSAALAASLGRSLELDHDGVRAGLYTALLLHVGCVGYAHETARLFGDEFVVQVAAEKTNLADPRDVVATLVPRLTRGRPPLERARLAATALTRGKRFGQAFDTASCEVGRDAARRLSLPEEVQLSVYHSSEWWNGGGAPDGLADEDIPVGARLALLASIAVLFDALGGVEAATDAMRRRRGGMIDPHMAEHFAERAPDLLGALHAGDPYKLVLDAEPQPAATVLGSQLLEVAAVFGDLADLKTPHLHGHSRGVAALSRDAGQRLGLATDAAGDLEVAGLLHDVGRVAVSNVVWDKPGPLDAHEWEQVRLHAYHSERILAGSQRLAPLARLVGMHHERCTAEYHVQQIYSKIGVSSRAAAAMFAMEHRLLDPGRRASLNEAADDKEERAMNTDRIHRATSADGTQIVARVHGQGPPLVIVPGGPADGETGWPSLLPHLTDRFTCFPINTRGRGLSADHPDHAHERLVEDIVAFVETIGDAVFLFGHSAGGTHALEAAAHTSAVAALALYEPTLTELADENLRVRHANAITRVRAAVDEGRPADGAQIFLDDLALANEKELALLSEVNATQAMAPLVPVVLEETAQSGTPQLSDLALLDRVTTPVLLLHGARTHPFYTHVVRVLAERLVDCRVQEIPEVGHLGPEIQPEPVAAELARLPDMAAAPQR